MLAFVIRNIKKRYFCKISLINSIYSLVWNHTISSEQILFLFLQFPSSTFGAPLKIFNIKHFRVIHDKSIYPEIIPWTKLWKGNNIFWSSVARVGVQIICTSFLSVNVHIKNLLIYSTNDFGWWSFQTVKDP